MAGNVLGRLKSCKGLELTYKIMRSGLTSLMVLERTSLAMEVLLRFASSLYKGSSYSGYTLE